MCGAFRDTRATLMKLDPTALMLRIKKFYWSASAAPRDLPKPLASPPPWNMYTLGVLQGSTVNLALRALLTGVKRSPDSEGQSGSITDITVIVVYLT